MNTTLVHIQTAVVPHVNCALVYIERVLHSCTTWNVTITWLAVTVIYTIWYHYIVCLCYRVPVTHREITFLLVGRLEFSSSAKLHFVSTYIRSFFPQGTPFYLQATIFYLQTIFFSSQTMPFYPQATLLSTSSTSLTITQSVKPEIDILHCSSGK